MATNDNLKDYLTALANSFRYATNSTEKIDAQDMLTLPVQLGNAYKDLQDNIGGVSYRGKEINVPLGITQIRPYAYRNDGDDYIPVINIPEGVETIKQNAFYNIAGRKNYVPSSLKVIEKDAIYKFGSISGSSYALNVYYSGTLQQFLSITKGSTSNIGSLWGNSYGHDSFNKANRLSNLYINNEPVDNVIVPKEITNVETQNGWGISGDFKFEDGSTLTKLIKVPYCNKLYLPKGNYEITYNFYTNMKPLPIKEGVYFEGTINDYFNLTFGSNTSNNTMFSYIGNLYINNELVEKINIPNGVYIIPAYSLIGYNYKYNEVVISKDVQEIERYAFYGQAYDSKQVVIRLLGTTPPTIQSNSFTDSFIVKYIVPASALNTYKTATNWSSRANKIFPDSNIEVSIDSSLLNNENILYSVDGGDKQQFTNTTLSLEGVGTLTIYNTSTDTIKLGNTSGGSEIGTSGPNTTITYTFTDVSNLYITKA